jgi:hypothetical protein
MNALVTLVYLYHVCMSLVTINFSYGVFLDIKDMGKEDRELPQSASKTGTKRRKDLDGDQNLKVAKAELDVITSRAAFASAKNTNDWEPKLMAQSKDSWSLAEECKRYVVIPVLCGVLEATIRTDFDLLGRW